MSLMPAFKDEHSLQHELFYSAIGSRAPMKVHYHEYLDRIEISNK